MSIRELTEFDREAAITFLKKEPSFNLFLIGNIFNYGFEKKFQQVWGDFDSSGELRAILGRFLGNYLPYAPKEFDIDGFAEIMEKGNPIQVLSATEEMVDYFETFQNLPLDWSSKKTFYFAELDRVDLLSEVSELAYSVRKMNVEDIEKVIQLSLTINELNNKVREDTEWIRPSLESGSGRGYVVEVEDQMIAMAQTVAENPHAAMIVGVGTDATYRNQGIASALVSRLCQDLLAEGKKVCLFYDNPDAGKIYKRLGFKDIGFWGVVKGKDVG
jgi:predicted GNAT family acetyltransferase